MNILEEFYSLIDHERIYETVYVTYLAGSVIVLASVVLSEMSTRELRCEAAANLRKAAWIIRSIQRKLASARQVMRKLERAITSAEVIISRDGLDLVLVQAAPVWTPETNDMANATTLAMGLDFAPNNDLLMMDHMADTLAIPPGWVPGPDMTFFDVSWA